MATLQAKFKLRRTQKRNLPGVVHAEAKTPVPAGTALEMTRAPPPLSSAGIPDPFDRLSALPWPCKSPGAGPQDRSATQA